MATPLGTMNLDLHLFASINGADVTHLADMTTDVPVHSLGGASKPLEWGPSTPRGHTVTQ